MKDCVWIFNHDYGLWEEFEQYEDYSVSRTKRVKYISYRRICSKCGRVQFRKVSVT